MLTTSFTKMGSPLIKAGDIFTPRYNIKGVAGLFQYNFPRKKRLLCLFRLLDYKANCLWDWMKPGIIKNVALI